MLFLLTRRELGLPTAHQAYAALGLHQLVRRRIAYFFIFCTCVRSSRFSAFQSWLLTRMYFASFSSAVCRRSPLALCACRRSYRLYREFCPSPVGAYGTAGAPEGFHAETEARAFLLAAVTRSHAAHCDVSDIIHDERARKVEKRPSASKTSQHRLRSRTSNRYFCVLLLYILMMFFCRIVFWVCHHRIRALHTERGQRQSASRFVGGSAENVPGCEV